MKRAEAAKCFISGLMDFRNASNGVTLAHCLATYGQVLALETVIENDPNIVNLVDDSGSEFKDNHSSIESGRSSGDMKVGGHLEHFESMTTHFSCLS